MNLYIAGAIVLLVCYTSILKGNRIHCLLMRHRQLHILDIQTTGEFGIDVELIE